MILRDIDLMIRRESTAIWIFAAKQAALTPSGARDLSAKNNIWNGS